MDGENNGKPYEKMDDLGGKPTIFGNIHINLKWWYPTIMGFPTKNGHFGVFWGYHYLRKHPYSHPSSDVFFQRGVSS